MWLRQYKEKSEFTVSIADVRQLMSNSENEEKKNERQTFYGHYII